MASILIFVYEQLIFNLLLQLGHMRNKSNQLASSRQFLKNLYRQFSGMLIKGTKAFIDQDGIQMKPPGIGLKDILKTKGKGKGGEEAFPA